MSNPLVAGKKDSTTGISGITILEGGKAIKDGIEHGEWASVAMGAFGVGLDALFFVTDPFGSILAAGVGWLMEHVGPLKEALDKLAGDPDQITAHSETWKNISKEVGSVSADLANQIKNDIQSWTGPGADAYRSQAEEVGKALEGAAHACEGAASGVKTAGEVVAAVRMLVRDTIAQVVAHMVSWALQVLFTMGIGLAWVVPQVAALVAKTAKQIAVLIKNLTKALGELGKLLGKAGKLFADATKSFKNLKPGTAAKPKGVDGLPRAKGIESSGGKTSPSRAGTEEGTTRGGANTAETKEPGKKACEFDPIDVATGDVLVTETDLEVPGVLGELLVREHVSAYRHGRWFGPSWASLVDERLEIAAGVVRYFSADAMVLTFPVPAPGAEVAPEVGPMRWLRETAGDFVVEDPGRGTLRVFSASDNRNVFPLREVRAEGGEFIELDRTSSGAPLALRHSGGAHLTFETADDRIRAVRAIADRGVVPVATYTYDEHGHLASRTNTSATPAHYQHDADGRLLGWTDHVGVWYRYVYDAEGRCVQAVGDGGFLDGTLSYEDGRTTTVDSLGHRKVFEFAGGDLVAETDKLGGVIRFEWGPHNLLHARVDPLGRRTEFEHDAVGVLRAVVRPDGSRVLVQHDATGLEIEVRQDGKSWRRRYTGDVPDPYTQQLGAHLDEDPVAAPAQTPEAEPERDLFGRVSALVSGDGGRRRLAWTVEGKLRSLTGPEGASRRWTHDAQGREISATDELGRVTVTEPGPFGTVRTITDPSGARTVQRYDTELRLIEVVNSLGASWRYTYDAEGRLISEQDFDGRVVHYTYDAAGQLVRAVNAAGEPIEYGYDLLGNLVERRTAQGIETFRYDPVGRLVHTAGPDAEVAFDRDEEGRVTAQTVAGTRTEFGYEPTVTTRRTPSGVDIRWERGEDGEAPDRITVAGVEVSLFHDAAGRVSALVTDGKPLVRQEFDLEGRLRVQYTPAGATRYLRRADGSLVERQSPAGGTRYEFDQAGRVTGVRGPRGVESYGYDPLGNLVVSSAGTGLEAGPRRYSGTVVDSAGAIRYAHDARGRMVRRTLTDRTGVERTWVFNWDTHDQLVGVRTPDGATWRYRYDPLGRRVAKQRLDAQGAVAEQVTFAWDGLLLIEAVHTRQGVFTGSLTWLHHPDDNRPVLQVTTAADGTRMVSALVTDDIGTPVEVASTTGSGVRPVWTSLWGLTAAGGDGGTPLRFPGQYLDPETGLHFNVFRYYDPGNARYLNPDPLGLAPAPNPVAYVGDPLTKLDPVGLTGSNGGWQNHFNPADFARRSDRASRKPCNAGASSAAASPPGANKRKADGTSSDKPNKQAKTDDYKNHQDAIDHPSGAKDKTTGRTTSQGGGTSGKGDDLDGSVPSSARGRKDDPRPGQCTDVIELNNAAKEGKLSPEVKNELGGWKGEKDGDVPFIRGHLQNDKLGGPGTSENLTPLSSKANKAMSKGFEEQLKGTDDWLRGVRANLPSEEKLVGRGFTPEQAKNIHADLNGLKADYEVKVSEANKFPNSTNGFEHSIRDHVNLDAGWNKDLHPETKAYLHHNGKLDTMPIFPPRNTHLDTMSGKMTTPDGAEYKIGDARKAMKSDFRNAFNNL